MFSHCLSQIGGRRGKLEVFQTRLRTGRRGFTFHQLEPVLLVTCIETPTCRTLRCYDTGFMIDHVL